MQVVMQLASAQASPSVIQPIGQRVVSGFVAAMIAAPVSEVAMTKDIARPGATAGGCQLRT
jgi:hypothetical protein